MEGRWFPWCRGTPVPIVPLAFVFPVFCEGFKETPLPKPPYQPLGWSYGKARRGAEKATGPARGRGGAELSDGGGRRRRRRASGRGDGVRFTAVRTIATSSSSHAGSVFKERGWDGIGRGSEEDKEGLVIDGWGSDQEPDETTESNRYERSDEEPSAGGVAMLYTVGAGGSGSASNSAGWSGLAAAAAAVARLRRTALSARSACSSRAVR